jgi:hypothetical protein
MLQDLSAFATAHQDYWLAGTGAVARYTSGFSSGLIKDYGKTAVRWSRLGFRRLCTRCRFYCCTLRDQGVSAWCWCIRWLVMYLVLLRCGNNGAIVGCCGWFKITNTGRIPWQRWGYMILYGDGNQADRRSLFQLLHINYCVVNDVGGS